MVQVPLSGGSGGASKLSSTMAISSGVADEVVLGAGDGDHHRHEVDVELLHRLARQIRVAGGQPVELQLFLGAVAGIELDAVAGRRDIVGDDVVGADAEGRDMLGELDAAIAHMVEQRLIGMGEADEAGKAEGAGAALDRVDGAKHRVQPVARAVAFLDGGELLLELEQELGTFVEIRRLEVVEVAQSRGTLLGFSWPFWLRKSSVHDAVDDRDQLFGVEWLHDPAGAAGSATLVALVLAGLGGEDQDGERAVQARGAHMLDELDAIHHRHVDVGDDDVDILGLQHVEALLAVLGLQHLETGIGEGVVEHRQDGPGIVYGQNAHRIIPRESVQTGRQARDAPLRNGTSRWPRPP